MDVPSPTFKRANFKLDSSADLKYQTSRNTYGSKLRGANANTLKHSYQDKKSLYGNAANESVRTMIRRSSFGSSLNLGIKTKDMTTT